MVVRGPVLREVPRDCLSDTPLASALWGFWCLNLANWMRCPLPFFLAFPPWRACEVEVRYPPLKRGISATLARCPLKTRQMGAIPPSAIPSRKGVGDMGGISDWAAKFMVVPIEKCTKEVVDFDNASLLSAPRSQRFLWFAIVMPIVHPRNRFPSHKTKQCCILAM